MGQDSLDCQQLQHPDPLAEIFDYLDGEASDALCAQIEQHLESCNDCQIVVDTLRQTVNLYRRLPQPDLPGAARERLYKTLELPPR